MMMLLISIECLAARVLKLDRRRARSTTSPAFVLFGLV